MGFLLNQGLTADGSLDVGKHATCR